MLPSLRSHVEYIQFVDDNLQTVQIPKAHEDVLLKLKLLDLTPLRLLFLPLYCLTLGRIGFPPEDLMRTFIAMVLCGITSPTQWVLKYLQDIPLCGRYPPRAWLDNPLFLDKSSQLKDLSQPEKQGRRAQHA